MMPSRPRTIAPRTIAPRTIAPRTIAPRTIAPRTIAPRTVAPRPGESGIALVVTMMAITLMTALGMALTLLTMTETSISANYREGTATMYAAEAAVEYVMQEVQRVPDWNSMLEGAATSAFVDGPPSGTRTVGATTLDLAQETDEVNASADESPWGADVPHWTLYAYGRLDDVLTPVTGRTRLYVVVWVADGSQMSEAETPEALAIRGHAYGPNAARRAVEVTVTRPDTSAEEEQGRLRVLSWRELR